MDPETEKNSIEHESGSLQPDVDTEKGLLRRFDWFILPTLAICYLFNSLNRSNVSNAQTGVSKLLSLNICSIADT